MDFFTFGKTQAAIELSTMLSPEENKHLAEKVSRFLDNYNKGIIELKKIETDSIRRRLFLIWREDCFSNLKKMDLPKEIKSFTRCVAVMKYREELRND